MNNLEISRRGYRQFFASLGFDEDPFQHTNADEEERLADYFVPPRYFPSVFGDPDHPKSFVVFAPRGGGKSAQRRIIENNCAENKVLSITYDRFEFPDLRNASDISLNHHLKNIIRSTLMGLLVTMHGDPLLRNRLTNYDQETFVRLSADYLADVNEITLKESLDSLKSLKDKVKDFWNKWLPIMNIGITTIIKKITDIDIHALDEFTSLRGNQSRYQKYNLERVIDLASKLGFRSIYVLIDRVDEAELTGNDSSASFQLMKPMLRDLELLEQRGIAFKFFLWDQLEPYYGEIARTDRIRQESLEWDDDMLIAMWNKRLKAFSQGKVTSLNDISEALGDYSADQLALIFANQSPRDMIRVGAQVFSEQQEISVSSRKISKHALLLGVDKFCARRADEIVTSNSLNDLRKIQQVDFTIPYLSNVVFRESQNTTRNRIMRWRREGAIVDVERVDNPNPQRKTQVKLFAIRDPRVAKIIHSDLDVLSFLEAKYKKCPMCNTSLLRDWGDIDSGTRCHVCQFDLLSDLDEDTWEAWEQKRYLAAESKRRYRRTQLEENRQLSFFDDNKMIGDTSD